MNMVFETNTVSILSIAAFVLAATAFIWLIVLEIRFRKLFRGRKVGSLETLMQDIQRELEEFSHKNMEIDKVIEMMEQRLKKSARHMGLVRFNPYADAGGDQSFALAVLDELQNGFVVSSLYGRDFNRVYAKPLEHGESQYQLSTEEKQAIEEALSK